MYGTGVPDGMLLVPELELELDDDNDEDREDVGVSVIIELLGVPDGICVVKDGFSLGSPSPGSPSPGSPSPGLPSSPNKSFGVGKSDLRRISQLALWGKGRK